MALNPRGSDSLAWTTGIDTGGLSRDAMRAKGILAGFARSISAMDVFAALSVGAALHAKKAIKEFTLLAARYETLGVVMRTVGNNAGYSADEMSKFQEGLEDTGISMIQSRQNLVRMVQAQLDLNQANKLARIAQDAAVIGNINSSEAFEKMIHGIQAAEVEVLRTIGINITFESGYKKLAETLGKNTDQLTDAEKAQSRMNSVLEAGTQIAGSYEASMSTAGKQLLSLERYVENLKVMLGAAFTPALTEIIENITGNIKDVNESLAENEDSAQDWGNNFRLIIISIEAKIIRLAMLIDKVHGTMSATYGILSTMGNIASGGLLFKDAMKYGAEKNVKFEDRYNEFLKALEELAKKHAEIEQSMTKEGKAAAKAAMDAAEQKLLAARKAAEAAKITPTSTKASPLFTLDAGNLESELARFKTAYSEYETTVKALGYQTGTEIYNELVGYGINYKQYLEKMLDAYKNNTEARKIIEKELARITIEEMENAQDANKKFNDWKISSSKELIQAEIARLDDEMASNNERENFDKGLFAERERRIQQLADYERNENRASLEDIIIDTRGWNKKQLKEYANFLNEQKELYEDNSVMKEEIIEKYYETMRDIYDYELEKIREIGDAFQELGNLIGQFDNKLGGIVSSFSDITSSISQIKNAKTDWGQYAGGLGILNTYVSIMKSLTGQTGDTSQQKTLKSLEKYTRAIDKNTEALRRSIGEDVIPNLLEVYASWEKKRDEALQDIKNIKTWDTRSGQYTGFTLGDLFSDDDLLNLTLGSDVLKKDKELYAELINIIEDADAKMFDNEARRKELLTATTAESIADSITDGLMKGLDAAEVFANTFEDLMKNAMSSAFNRKIVDQMLSPFYDEFADLAKNGLTKDEIEYLRILFSGYKETTESAYNAISELWESLGFDTGTSESGTKATGMTGAISGITEDTAGLLAGQFNAMRVNTANILKYVSSILNASREIRDNTYYNDDIWKQLVNINDGKLLPVLNASREIRDNTYYNDDIWKQLVNINDGKLLPILNASREIRDNTYYNDDIWKQLVNINDGKLLPILNASREIRDNTYYNDDIWKQLGFIVDINKEIRDNSYYLSGISNIVTYQKRIADNTDYLQSIDRRLMNIETYNINYTRVVGS